MSTSSRPTRSAEAVARFTCPICRAAAGERCVDVTMRPTHRGRVIARPHIARRDEARKAGY